jgi:hypothetical protein
MNKPKQNKPQVYFVFPYRGVGGVPVLFVRIGEYLASKGTIDAFFVDYVDGAMSKMMMQGLGHLVPYEDDGHALIPDDAYAIFQSMSPWSIFPRLVVADTVKLLFWNCHPFNLIPTLPGIRKYMQTHIVGAKWLLRTLMFIWRKRMRAFLDVLIKHQAIVFMDVNNVNTTQTYLQQLISNAAYLPIPVSTTQINSALQKHVDWSQNRAIRIVWVGRVVDFKFFILKRSLCALNTAQAILARPIEFTIVGDGDFSDALQIVADQVTQLKVKFIKRIDITELDDFLLNEADLIMAMGTSVLEGARLGIPAILLDMSYQEVSERYHFQWLYHRKGYTLADMISTDHFLSHNQSLLHRLKELIDDYQVQSERCQQYVVTHHGLEAQSDRLLDYLGCSKLSWGYLRQQGYLHRGWFYPVFKALRSFFQRR